MTGAVEFVEILPRKARDGGTEYLVPCQCNFVHVNGDHPNRREPEPCEVCDGRKMVWRRSGK